MAIEKTDFMVIARLLQGAFGRRLPADLLIQNGSEFIQTDAFNVWYKALKDYDLRELTAAVQVVIKTGKAPYIADIVETIQQHNSQQWEMVYAECIANAPYMLQPVHVAGPDGNPVPVPVKWSSPMALAMFNFIGAQHWASLDQKDIGTFKAQFRDTFNKMNSVKVREQEFQALGAGHVPVNIPQTITNQIIKKIK